MKNSTSKNLEQASEKSRSAIKGETTTRKCDSTGMGPTTGLGKRNRFSLNFQKTGIWKVLEGFFSSFRKTAITSRRFTPAFSPSKWVYPMLKANLLQLKSIAFSRE